MAAAVVQPSHEKPHLSLGNLRVHDHYGTVGDVGTLAHVCALQNHGAGAHNRLCIHGA